MGGFGSTLNISANAMTAIQRALDAVQNNVVNANTAGYAAEQVGFSARSFEPTSGLAGGVQLELSSTRDEYLEQSVRSETSALGFLTQQGPLLDSLQAQFSVSGDAGVPGALSSLASSFAKLSTNPGDMSARANVIQAASALAQSFNDIAASISQISTQAAQQASSTVDQINTLSSHIARLNAKIQGGAQSDAGLAADLNRSLESLSNLVNISVSYGADGSASVLLGGQTPLVLGSAVDTVQLQNQPANPAANYPNAPPKVRLVTQDGNDVTAQATQGQLGALLATHNNAIPTYLGDSTQPGELNRLAKTFADRVNQILTTGQVSSGPPAVPGTALFSYSTAGDTSIAASLAVNTGITPDQIATIDPGPPLSSNGTASELANLTNPSNSADFIDGQSFTAFYGQLSGQAGAASAQSATDLQTQQDLTAQAQNQRSQASGVSLNDQAAQLLTLQQAYQATAKLITVLDNLSQAAIDMLPQV